MPVSKSPVGIVTDSTASLPPLFAEQHDIPVVPQIIVFGEEEFKEGVDLTYEEFLRRLKAGPELPKTAAPLPADLLDAYHRQLKSAETIISIHPSSDVSGTVRSAQAVKADCFPDADIRIVDTRTIAGNLGSMVIAATQLAERGTGAGEIVDCLNEMIPRGRTYFLVSTLEFLQKGGRIGGAAALIGSALQIKPILEIRNGRVEAFEKVRGYRHAWERMKELVVDQCPRSSDARITVMYTGSDEAARRFATELRACLGFEEIPVLLAGSAITTHGGPGVVAVGFFV